MEGDLMTLCCEPVLSRRVVAGLGAGLFAASLLPWPADAAEVDALAFSCIDFRLVDAAVKFFDGDIHPKDYDLLALAGASLGAVSPKFPSSNDAFWNHVDIAKSLHHIKKVVVLDHRDCGAYKVAFGKAFAAEHNAETVQHKSMMLQLKTALAQKHPELASEFYLMALDGTAEKIA
jgi:carbonic anhydrase